MKIITFLPNNMIKEQVDTLIAFSNGLIDLGYKVSINSHDNVELCDVAVVFGWNKPYHKEIERVIKEFGGRVLVLSYGLFNRPKYWTAGWDNLSGRADYVNENSPSDRWDEMGAGLKPWKSTGEHILVTCQVPTDGSVYDIDIFQWSQDTIDLANEIVDYPIRFRPHPLATNITPDMEGSIRSEASFEEDLLNAKAIITYNSTSSSMAIFEGIPLFAMDRGSMAWDVANKDLKDLNNPKMFDRGQWSHNLGYCQWTLDEFKDGTAWDHLKRGVLT